MRTPHHVSSWDLDLTLPLLIGGLIIAGLGVAAFFWRRGSSGAATPRKRTNPFRTDQFDFNHYDREYGDQRTSTRRGGGYVPLLLSSPSFRDGLKFGVVLDRSTGGLRIASEVPVVPGCPLQLMAEEAPPDTPWVAVAVRSCTPDQDRFVLGCEFETTPPWNVLLLFG
jgi:hypothetical protein